jgi:hypothetical protein
VTSTVFTHPGLINARSAWPYYSISHPPDGLFSGLTITYTKIYGSKVVSEGPY